MVLASSGQRFEPSGGRRCNGRGIPKRRVLPIIYIGHNAANAFAKTYLWSPPEVTPNTAGISPGTFWLAWSFGDMDHLAFQKFNQTIDRLRIASAEIPNSSN